LLKLLQKITAVFLRTTVYLHQPPFNPFDKDYVKSLKRSPRHLVVEMRWTKGVYLRAGVSTRTDICY